MPALYAHLRFGEEVLKALPPYFSAHAEKYPQAFALGTQGPDILFYHHPMKKNEIRTQGTRLHALAAEDFFLDVGKQLLESAESTDAETLITRNGAFSAYICGFLCHFALDVSTHAYIDEQSYTPQATDKPTHGKIESEFDKFLLKKDGKPIRGYNTATPIRDENGTREACAKALRTPQENIARAIKTMRKINGYFSKKCPLFHPVVHACLALVGMERKFGDMFIHKKDDPRCAHHNLVLEEKLQNAIPVGANLIENYFSHLDELCKGRQNEELFRYNYSGIKI